jgi:curved DNA-binding protein CbpA
MSAPLPTGTFQDHYSVLGIAPNATPDTIHKAYSALASKYHPRNPETRDQAKYEAVTRAYEVLSDPDARRAFDALLPKSPVEDTPTFGGRAFFESVAGENCRRLCILCILYDRRRQDPANPAMVLRNLEAMVLFPLQAIQFSLWYLKQRGWVVSDDKSSLQITADGMEYLEAHMPPPELVYSQLKPSAVASPGDQPEF